jgi:hypothetical protein
MPGFLPITTKSLRLMRMLDFLLFLRKIEILQITGLV